MNIALLIESLATGGAERVVQQLALGLRRREHGVQIYCLKDGGALAETARRQGVVVREARSTGFDPGLAWRLANWLREDRSDVAHAHSSAAAIWVLPGARLLGVPLVQTRHGALLGQATRYRRLADQLARHFAAITIVSESLRADLPTGRARRSAACIPNGVDHAPLPPAEARRALERVCGVALTGPVVLSVGTVCAEKDTRGLMRAMALLRREMPDVRLVCIGASRDPAYEKLVREDSRALGLGDCVHWPGAIDEAQRLMAGADVFCQPSRSEALPVAILEAMGQRVPIVASAVGDVGQLGPATEPGRYVLRHNETGLLVPPGDPQALAAALCYALSDRAAAGRRAARAAEECAWRYSTRQMVASYESLYTTCTERPAGVHQTRRPTRQARRPRVLMLGPAAPQMGGMVSVIDALLNSDLRQRCDLFRLATTYDPQAVTRRPAHGPLRRLARIGAAALRHLAKAAELARVLRHERISILHIHTCSYFTFYRNLADLALARLLRRRVVLHIHGGRFARFCAESSPLGKWIVRRGCEAADATIVLSQGWRDCLAAHVGRARLLVVPNGTALPRAPAWAGSRFRPGSDEHDSYECPARVAEGERGCRFLFLGPLTVQKGLNDLIEAATRLKRDDVHFELIIAGPAPDQVRRQWEQRVGQVGLTEQVRFVGPMGGQVKEDLYESADCLVLPSHSEGLPLTILEAAVRGCAVVATAVGGIPEFMCPPAQGVSETLAPLVPAHNPAALAETLKQMAQDAALRRTVAARLHAHVQANYSLERQAGELLRLYEGLVAGGAGCGTECKHLAGSPGDGHAGTRLSAWVPHCAPEQPAAAARH